MKHLISLEDNGQDFLQFVVENNVVIESIPFQTSVWKGMYIPVENLKVGELCLVHNPPHINFGALKHKVEKIEVVE